MLTEHFVEQILFKLRVINVFNVQITLQKFQDNLELL